jgi:hypothetical protein
MGKKYENIGANVVNISGNYLASLYVFQHAIFLLN